MNIAFYVSGKATRVRRILEENLQDILKDTKFVFSDDANNSYLKSAIEERGISYFCFNHKELEPTEGSKNLTMSNELLNLLRKYEVDYCFSFGDHLLVGELLTHYENRIINFHPSILPLYPGRKAIDQAVAAGSCLLGNTAHFINAGVDEGPIIMQHIQSSRNFVEGEYNVVLDNQIAMIRQIHIWLKENRIHVVDNKVIIQGADYNANAFFPSLESQSK